MPLSGYQREQLFAAKEDIRDSRHQAKITGIRLGGLMDQLKFQQDVTLAGQERVHEWERGNVRVAAGQERYLTDINQSLDAPDPDDDRNIRPVFNEETYLLETRLKDAAIDAKYEGRQIKELERQIAKEKVFQHSEEERREKDSDSFKGLLVLVFISIFIAAQRNFKAY